MNDLVFVMYNLKLKRRQEKRASKSVIHQPIVLDELPSDDEWITEVEEPVLPASNTWINSLDRASRRFARAVNNGDDGIDVEFDESQCMLYSSSLFLFTSLNYKPDLLLIFFLFFVKLKMLKFKC